MLQRERTYRKYIQLFVISVQLPTEAWRFLSVGVIKKKGKFVSEWVGQLATGRGVACSMPPNLHRIFFFCVPSGCFLGTKWASVNFVKLHCYNVPPLSSHLLPKKSNGCVTAFAFEKGQVLLLLFYFFFSMEVHSDAIATHKMGEYAERNIS